MRKFVKVFSAVLVGAGLFAPSLAQAQELTLSAEVGAAAPLTDPQANRFHVGAAGAVKPELGLGSYFSVGPVVQVVQLPSKVAGVEAGNGWSYGGFLRFKRPHDENNTGRGLSAVSPWVDLDVKLVHTDPLDRFGSSIGVGASVPTSDSRWLWVGPYVRYDMIHQEDGKVGVNTNSSKMLIVGLHVQLGAPMKKAAEQQPVPPPPPPPVVVPEPKPEPKPLPPTVMPLSFKPVVQFAWDSYKLEPAGLELLAEVVKAMLAEKNYNVQIAGHASSEGQVEHNNVLAQNRANSVLEFLVANGVERKRLTAVGFGSRVPVADNKTEAGRVANRRVEFDVTFTLVDPKHLMNK